MQAPTPDALQQPSGLTYNPADGQIRDQQLERGQAQQLHSTAQPQEPHPPAVISDVAAALDQHYGQPYLLGSHHAFDYADEQSSDAQQQVGLCCLEGSVIIAS